MAGVLNTPKGFLIGGIINRIRAIQGWNLLSPGETATTAEIWLNELDRHNVTPEIYGRLVDLAADERIKILAAGGNAPQFSAELLLAMHRRELIEISNNPPSLEEKLRFDAEFKQHLKLTPPPVERSN